MRGEFCQLWLSCVNEGEASIIARSLLDKKLIACAKQVAVNSTFRWQGKIESSDEILLIMESRVDLFENVEAEVKKLHSYDTFVLEAVPIEKISAKAQDWLKETLHAPK